MTESADHIVQLDQFRYHHALEETPGRSLVFFTGPHCGACKVLRRVLAGLAADMDLSVFEVDAERDLALAREFAVFHLPSMFLYVDGEYHCELQAEARGPAIAAAIEAAMARPAEEAP
jgi:thiol-disulfide isomerase/thioredoxin